MNHDLQHHRLYCSATPRGKKPPVIQPTAVLKRPLLGQEISVNTIGKNIWFLDLLRHWIKIWETCIQFLYLSETSCVTLGTSLHFWGPPWLLISKMQAITLPHSAISTLVVNSYCSCVSHCRSTSHQVIQTSWNMSVNTKTCFNIHCFKIILAFQNVFIASGRGFSVLQWFNSLQRNLSPWILYIIKGQVWRPRQERSAFLTPKPLHHTSSYFSSQNCICFIICRGCFGAGRHKLKLFLVIKS